MQKFFSCLILSIILILCVSCGKKGPIYPPIVKAPKAVEDFAVFQRGDKIRLIWKNPTAYKDGAPLESIGEVEVWLAKEEKPSKKEEEDEEGGLFKEEEISGKDFQNKAELIKAIEGGELSSYVGEVSEGFPFYWYIYELEDKDFHSKKYVFGLRVIDRKKRQSGFSKILSVEPRILPVPPQNLRLSVFVDHVSLMWDSPEKNMDGSSPANVSGYTVYRQEAEGKPVRLNPKLIEKNEFRDWNFRFDVSYQYYVRASITDTYPYLESSDSEPVEISPKDTFPPQSPVGIIVMSGADSISLSWDENTEKDFGGYRVWRKKEGEEKYTLLTPDPIRENTFTDTDVEKNKRYHYAVTALDKLGNESEKSSSVSETIKDSVHENLPF